MQQPNILVVGSLVMDLIVATERFPEAGETVLGQSYRTAPGGKGANQAAQAARLGAHVSMVGKVGDDDFGRALTGSLQEFGVDTSQVGVAPAGVSSAVGNVLLTLQNGRTLHNRIIVVSGANMAITPADLAPLKDKIKHSDMLILQLEIPMDIIELTACWAHDAGVPVMLNSAPSAPLSDTLLACLTYLCPNEHEAADLTGVTIGRGQDGAVLLEDVKKAADVLHQKGVEKVLVTLGDGGAALSTASGELIHRPCVSGIDAVDPTAAGDSFVGAFCAGVCAGMTDEQALTLANYTAAITVSRMGAQPSLPSLAEVEQLMQARGFEGFSPALLDRLKGE